MSFDAVYLVFKGMRYIVVKVKDMELIERIVDYMKYRDFGIRSEEPMLNFISNEPLTNFVVNDDYNGENRNESVEKYTSYSNIPKRTQHNRIIKTQHIDNTQNHVYISNVLRELTNNNQQTETEKIYQCSQEDVNKVLEDLEVQETIDINGEKGFDSISSEQNDEKYPELLDLLSESITASWIEILPFDRKYKINDRKVISLEDSWIDINPTAPIMDE